MSDQALPAQNRSRRVALTLSSFLARPSGVGHSDLIATVPAGVGKVLSRQSSPDPESAGLRRPAALPERRPIAIASTCPYLPPQCTKRRSATRKARFIA